MRKSWAFLCEQQFKICLVLQLVTVQEMDTKMLIIMQFSPVALHEMLVKLNLCNHQNDHFEPVFCRSVLDCTVSCLFLSHWQNIRARETTYYMLQSSITLPQTQSWKLTTELAPLFHSDNRTFAALQLKYLLRGYYTIFHRDFCEVHLHVQGSDCKFAVISLKRVSLLLSGFLKAPSSICQKLMN